MNFNVRRTFIDKAEQLDVFCSHTLYIKQNAKEFNELVIKVDEMFKKFILPFKRRLYHDFDDSNLRLLFKFDVDNFEYEFAFVKNYINGVLNPEIIEFFDLDKVKNEAKKKCEDVSGKVAQHVHNVKHLFSADILEKVKNMSRFLNSYKTYYCYLACMQDNIIKNADIVIGINLMHKSECLCQKYIVHLTDFASHLSSRYNMSSIKYASTLQK